MILTCPNCSTRYSVNAKAFGESGRDVRCAQCGHKWHATAEPEPEIELDKPVTEHSAKDRDETAHDAAATDAADLQIQAQDGEQEKTQEEKKENSDTPKAPHASWRAREAQRKRQKRRRIAFAIWGGVLLILALLFGIAIVHRTAVVRFWPNTASLYAALGMKIDLWGVALEKTSVQRLIVGDANVLRISGEVKNTSKTERHVPLVQISLRDETGATLYQWTVSPGPAELAPGEVAVFKTEVSNPPDNAVGIDFNFTAADPAQKPLAVPQAPPTGLGHTGAAKEDVPVPGSPAEDHHADE